ncbi:hypothetical protein, partial [Flavonifractor plautii]|uniref:hypothetical protein n=1 Tax=Flavonifractor plautii TaxID=292800 RepID=UPI003D7DC534
GKVTFLDDSETGASEHWRLAAAGLGPRVDYASIRAITAAVLKEFGWAIETVPSDDPVFLPGRGAEVWGSRGGERVRLGLAGE